MPYADPKDPRKRESQNRYGRSRKGSDSKTLYNLSVKGILRNIKYFATQRGGA